MFDTVAQLLEQIRLGEDSSLELKTIVFAGDKVEGPDRQDVAERFAHEIVRDVVKPPLFPRIERMLLPGADGQSRPIIKVDVPRSLWVHQSPGGYFHRVGSTKRHMDPDYLGRLMQQRSQARLIRFDEQVVGDSSIDDLHPELVESFRTARSKDELGPFLR